MAKKQAKPASAEASFKKKALRDEIETHEPIITWSDEFYRDSHYDTKQNAYVQDPNAPKQQKYVLTCNNKNCQPSTFVRWRGTEFVNKDGYIGATSLRMWNTHILEVQSDREEALVSTEAALVMRVTLHRGGQHEYWIAHMNDKDFFEGAGKQPMWNSSSHPWKVVWRDTQGWKPIYSGYSTRDEAVAEAIKRKQKYLQKGYQVEVLERTVSGVIPVAATTAISVRKLIDDYKALGDADKKNPGKVKPWLDKANDAIVQLELLEQLRDEVQEDFMESLVL